MIYILDNQLAYSDHVVAFVEVPQDLEDGFLALLERDRETARDFEKSWKIIAARVDADWREPSAIRSADDFMQEVAEEIAWRVD